MADDELAQLEALHEQGMLTDVEYKQAQARVRARLEERAQVQGRAETATDVQPSDGSAAQPETPHAVEPSQAAPDGGAKPRRHIAPYVLGALLVAGIALIGAALFAFPSSTPGIAVNGIVVIRNQPGGPPSVLPDDRTVVQGQTFGTGGYAIGKACHALTGYEDIVGGATVVISDAAGHSLVTTHLRPGVFDAEADCVFGFSTDVAKGKKNYQVVVAHRQGVPFTEQEIVNPMLGF